MSDNIPFEIQTDIIQRIPDTKSLIQCRSVSKAWKSMIDSKEFVTAHTLRHQANRHLLIGKRDYGNTQVNYVSIVDDDTFPHQKLNVFVPDSVDKFSNHPKIIGTSHGLFCFFVSKPDTVLIWNPSIRKTVDIAVPNVFSKRHLSTYSTVVGFGVCPGTLDPKLVKITYVSDLSRLRYENASIQVEVFTLSSGGTWRSPLSSNVPHMSIGFEDSQVVIDGFIYWEAFDRIHVGHGFRTPKLIMSFDLTSEEFTKVNLPDCLALEPNAHLSLSNLRESLAVLDLEINGEYNREFNRYNQREIYHVWMMIGHGCTRSFNKLYSINATDASICTTLGFRKSGAPIVVVTIDKEDYYKYELAIYEPESKSNTNIGIYGTYFVHSYMETLLLLGH